MSVLILVIKKSDFKAKNINIAIISTNSYCAACYFKRAEIFVVIIKEILYQTEKKTRVETNSRSIVP